MSRTKRFQITHIGLYTDKASLFGAKNLHKNYDKKLHNFIISF